MNLFNVKDTIIGSGDRLKGTVGGISGGEKRRLETNHFSHSYLIQKIW
jgi:hypothetical protein